MRWTPWIIVVMATAMAVHAVGCRTPTSTTDPPDPLLIGKKPQEGKVDDPPSVAVVPAPPTMPVSPQATWGSDVSPTVRLQRPDSQAPSNRLQATTVSYSTEKTTSTSTRLGYARDYTWLQGAVERAGKDRWLLRYAAPSGSDYWGGVVCLEPDARLAMLTEGALVRVEGDMVKEEGRVQVAAWLPYPRYQVQRFSVQSK